MIQPTPQRMPLRVLLIEDSEDDAALLLRALRSGGYEPACERIETSEAMTAALSEMEWNLVIADHNLPHFNSLAALAVLKDSRKNIPFIIVSGAIRDETATAAMNAGAQDYISKQNLARLVPVVDRELQQARLRLALQQTQKLITEAHESLKTTVESAVQALALLAETCDAYTAGHQRRVAELSVVIAREMRLPEDQVRGIRLAAAVHDIGKMSISPGILAFPGKLTPVEMAIVKTHPQVSYNLLRSVQSPWPIAQVALQHHERTDGSGYPLGLQGDDIALESRILGVADTMDAMLSARPYRAALTLDNALGELCDYCRSQYDRSVVDACVTLFREKGFILPNP